MLEQFDPTVIAIALTLWPAARSIVFIGAAAVSLWSRHEQRRRTAERIMRLLRPPANHDEPRR
jgi:hypothetical protein